MTNLDKPLVSVYQVIVPGASGMRFRVASSRKDACGTSETFDDLTTALARALEIASRRMDAGDWDSRYHTQVSIDLGLLGFFHTAMVNGGDSIRWVKDDGAKA